MSEPDYRALCAELAQELVNEYGYCTEWEKGLPLCESNVSELLNRARAALTQPEPVAPTDEALMAALKSGIASFPPRHPEAEHLSAVEYEVELEIRKARAVLARLGRPTPQPPSRA